MVSISIPFLLVLGNDWIQDGLENWNKLHACRSLVVVGAFTTMVFLLVKGPN